MIGGVGRRVSSPVLVGRDAEVAQLRVALERAAAGRPAVMVVAGEAGVGKTRLVGELVGQAGGLGAVALTGGCLDVGEGVLAYAPLVEALRPLVVVLDPGELDRVLGGARTELARLVPELAPEAGGRRAEAPLARRGCSSCCSGCCTAWPSAARSAGGGGPALGRPVDPRPGGLPGPQPARRGGADPHLPVRRAAPPPPAAAVPGRAGPQRPGRAAGAGPAGPPGPGRAAGRDPRGAGPAGAGRGGAGPLGGQPVLRRGAAGRPPGRGPAAVGPAGPAAGPGGGAVGAHPTGAGDGRGGRHPGRPPAAGGRGRPGRRGAGVAAPRGGRPPRAGRR